MGVVGTWSSVQGIKLIEFAQGMQSGNWSFGSSSGLGPGAGQVTRGAKFDTLWEGCLLSSRVTALDQKGRPAEETALPLVRSKYSLPVPASSAFL
jgi:hypothetical protein